MTNQRFLSTTQQSVKPQLSPRLLFVPLMSVLVFSVLLLRVFDLQVAQGKELREVSEHNRIFTKRIVANRGILLDRFGHPLVLNKPIYFKLHDPQQLYSQRELIDDQEALDLMAQQPAAVFSEQYRQYVYPEALSQVTGYVAPVTKEDLDRNDQLHIEQQIGKVGLEGVFQKQLVGVDGSIVFETNSKGEIIRQIETNPAVSGENITTTLDGELSEFIYKLMANKRGAVIVGDPTTGEVLSMLSTPTFNANRFTQPARNSEEETTKKQIISGYFQDPLKLFFNRALAGGYPPGSVFKPITAIAGLETEAIDIDTVVEDQGILKVGEFEYGNWYYRQYGRTEGNVNVVRALTRSNDIFFYKAAEWIGPDRLAEMSRMFGYGSPTGLELPAEASGVVPNPAWKEKTIGEQWFLGNTYHYGIGQGDLLVTPAQVFQSITPFASNGRLCAPTLIKGKVGQCKELSLSAENLEIVKEGMIGACSAGGTAFPFFPWNQTKDNKVSCKTGTAEFGPEDAKGHRKTHGWLVAFADLATENYPKTIELTVLVESDEEQPFREGSKDAAPIALEIMKWIEEHR